MAITKADLLRRKTDPEEVFIELLGDSVLLAPLSSGQYTQVEAIQMSGIKARGKVQAQDPEMEFDVSKVNENQKVAAALAVTYSLNNADPQSKWSQEEVKSLAPDVVEAIAEEVFRLTGVDPVQPLSGSVASFRENSRGDATA